jgi:hypothetical protein
MAIVQRPRKDGKVTYWVTYSVRNADGELDTKWERAGTSQRKAEGLERQRKEEIKNGTYVAQLTGQVTVETWFDEYFKRVKYRSADDDRDRIRLHVTPRKWFSQMLIQDVRQALFAPGRGPKRDQRPGAKVHRHDLRSDRLGVQASRV